MSITKSLDREKLIIPELEEIIRLSSHGWATDEVKATILIYWGIAGANRQVVYKAICKKFELDVSFNQMRYFVNTYMREELAERDRTRT